MVRNSTNVRNSSWNLANILIYPILFLAATPYFIDSLSESVFGEWMLINSYIFITVHLIGFGLPDSITAHIAQARGMESREKEYAYINASMRILGRMALFSVLLAATILTLSFATPSFFSKYLWVSLVLATLIITFRFPEILFQSLFKGRERYDQAAIFNMAGKIGGLLLQVILIMQGFSLTGVFTGSLAALVLVVVLQALYFKKLVPEFRLHLNRRSEEQREIYHFGFWSWLQNVISLASYQMDRFIVAWFLGTATVAYYVLASTIANHLNMAFDAVVAWLLPKVSRLRKSLGDTRSHFHTIRAFSIGSSLLVIGLLYLVSEPLFTLWLGPEKYLKMKDFFHLFMIFEAFLVLAIVPKFYLNAIRELSFNTGLELLAKSAVIAGMVLSFMVFNTAESLIWGQIAALILSMPIIYFLINNKLLHENRLRETLMTQLPSLAILGMIVSPNYVVTLICFFLSGLLFWLVYGSRSRFQAKILFE